MNISFRPSFRGLVKVDKEAIKNLGKVAEDLTASSSLSTALPTAPSSDESAVMSGSEKPEITKQTYDLLKKYTLEASNRNIETVKSDTNSKDYAVGLSSMSTASGLYSSSIPVAADATLSYNQLSEFMPDGSVASSENIPGRDVAHETFMFRAAEDGIPALSSSHPCGITSSVESGHRTNSAVSTIVDENIKKNRRHEKIPS